MRTGRSGTPVQTVLLIALMVVMIIDGYGARPARAKVRKPLDSRACSGRFSGASSNLPGTQRHLEHPIETQA
jgi:hypothetical protein